MIVVDQARGQAGLQFAAAGLALDAALQAGADHVQLGFAHGPFEPEQQPVVETARVVQAVLVEDQRAGQGTEFQQAVPVAGVASQSGDLQAQHDPRASHAHLGHQLLKAFPVRCRRGGQPLVLIDRDHTLGGPAQLNGLPAQRILTPGALRVLDHLVQRGLTHVEIGVPLQVFRVDFLTVATHVDHLLSGFQNHLGQNVSDLAGHLGQDRERLPGRFVCNRRRNLCRAPWLERLGRHHRTGNHPGGHPAMDQQGQSPATGGLAVVQHLLTQEFVAASPVHLR